MRVKILLSLIFVCLAFITNTAHAETDTWSFVVEGRLNAGTAWQWERGGATPKTGNFASKSGSWMFVKDILVNVKYRASLVNEDTGAVIACGSSVPKGTRVRLKFDEHSYQDVDWSGTGGGVDSPYGYWVSGATPPPGGRCADKDVIKEWESKKRIDYVALSVNPPTKTIEGYDTSSCVSSGSDKICTLNEVGTVSPQFIFAETYGHFFPSMWHTKYEDGVGDAHDACIWPRKDRGLIGGVKAQGTRRDDGTYILKVPQRTINCSVNVIEASGTPPTKPTIVANGACVVGSQHSITVSNSSDPDNDEFRYVIDWGHKDPVSGAWVNNNTDTASTQYVTNNNATVPVPKTHATAGVHTVRVRAEDKKGMSSPWSEVAFSCADGATGSTASGIVMVDTGAGGTGVVTSPDDLQITASVMVRRGATARVWWASRNMTQCEVSGTNGDGGTPEWETLASPTKEEAPPDGGVLTGIIPEQTVYTLSCVGVDGVPQQKSAVVNILPLTKEK